MGPPCSTTLIPLMVDIENQPDSAPDDEAGGPLSMLLMPVVAAVDSARWAGRNIGELGRWVTRVLSPMVIWLREFGQRVAAFFVRFLKPILNPLTTLNNLIERIGERIGAVVKPAADRMYAAPLAAGRAWGRFKSRVGMMLKRLAGWLAATNAARRIAALVRRIRDGIRRRAAPIRDAVRRAREVIRSRLSR